MSLFHYLLGSEVSASLKQEITHKMKVDANAHFSQFPLSKDSGQIIPRVVESCIRYINLFGKSLTVRRVKLKLKLRSMVPADVDPIPSTPTSH